MEIMRVVDELVATQRVSGLQKESLRVLENLKGKLSVATDAVGAPPGEWVITASGSAARYAMPDPSVITDLTIIGIIDHWEDDGGKTDG